MIRPVMASTVTSSRLLAHSVTNLVRGHCMRSSPSTHQELVFTGGMRFPGDRCLPGANATYPLAVLRLDSTRVCVQLRFRWNRAMAGGWLPTVDLALEEITSVNEIHALLGDGLCFWYGDGDSVLFWCYPRVLARVTHELAIRGLTVERDRA